MKTATCGDRAQWSLIIGEGGKEMTFRQAEKFRWGFADSILVRAKPYPHLPRLGWKADHRLLCARAQRQTLAATRLRWKCGTICHRFRSSRGLTADRPTRSPEGFREEPTLKARSRARPAEPSVPLFEEAADQGDAVGDAARRIEFGRRAAGVGRPVGAGFGDFHKSGAHGERRMAGEIGDGEHFIAQRRNQQ